MNRLAKNLGIVDLVRREARAVLELSPWVLVSLLVMVLLWRSNLAATSGLFQSPPPTGTSILTPTPTVESAVPTATEVPTLVPTSVPTQPPVATAEPTATLQPVASSTPALATPTQTVETPTTVPPTMTEIPSASSTPGSSDSDDQNRYPEGDSNLRFEWGMLVDSFALGLSYVWLCCGILVFLSIPVLFIVLWVASKRHQQGEE